MLIGTDRNRKLVLALAGGVVGALLAVTQVWPQMGPGMGSGRFYNPSTEITVHGVVDAVQNVAYRCRWGGTHVTLKTEQRTYDVRLGPTLFLSQNNFSLAKGDTLSVTGSKLQVQGATVLVAREVSRNGKTLTLRNAQGFPAWAGRGMGGRNWAQGRCRGFGGPGCGCCRP
jgi:hypothetical protein